MATPPPKKNLEECLPGSIKKTWSRLYESVSAVIYGKKRNQGQLCMGKLVSRAFYRFLESLKISICPQSRIIICGILHYYLFECVRIFSKILKFAVPKL
jgi:hypothetical protein